MIRNERGRRGGAWRSSLNAFLATLGFQTFVETAGESKTRGSVVMACPTIQPCKISATTSRTPPGAVPDGEAVEASAMPS